MNHPLRHRSYQQAEKLHASAGCSDIVVAIVLAAAEYWDTINPQDFCVQSFNPDLIIFGITNRLIWTPAHGFRPDRSYCTKEFQAAYDQIGPLPGSPNHGGALGECAFPMAGGESCGKPKDWWSHKSMHAHMGGKKFCDDSGCHEFQPNKEHIARKLVRRLVGLPDGAERTQICAQLKALRWKDKFCCPTCGSGVIQAAGGNARKCGDCGHVFMVPGF